MALPELLSEGPKRARLTLALAHGAGAPMDSPFMDGIARELAGAGVRVVRFEFPYMARRRRDSRRRPPDRQPALLECWRAVIGHLGPARLVVGGKSMGGRMASLIADQAGVRGLVCLGYPFHPAGRPEPTRTAHLAHLRTPALIVQGARDALGSREEVARYDLSPGIRLHWIEDGNHDLVPRKASGRGADQCWTEAVAAVIAFLKGL